MSSPLRTVPRAPCGRCGASGSFARAWLKFAAVMLCACIGLCSCLTYTSLRPGAVAVSHRRPTEQAVQEIARALSVRYTLKSVNLQGGTITTLPRETPVRRGILDIPWLVAVVVRVHVLPDQILGSVTAACQQGTAQAPVWGDCADNDEKASRLLRDETKWLESAILSVIGERGRRAVTASSLQR